MNKPNFQSTESFLQDYDAYKDGRTYKLIQHDGKVEYVRGSIVVMRADSLKSFGFLQGIVDLKHKFEKVCKV